MCRLVIGTPRSYCISNMSTPKLDLSVLAHDGGDVRKSLWKRVIAPKRKIYVTSV